MLCVKSGGVSMAQLKVEPTLVIKRIVSVA